MKLKVISSALSLVILCSAPLVNAEPLVVGKLVANPTAIVSAGEMKQRVGTQATSYIEGDTITTEADSNAKVSLTSGLANVVIAPDTVMSVDDASQISFSLTKGAFSVDAQSGKVISIDTPAGLYQLSSDSSVNAVVTFNDGVFAAVSKSGLLNVEASNGVVTPIESGNGVVFNETGANSVDVQAAGGDVHEHEAKNGEISSHAHDSGLVSHSHGSGYFTVNNALIAGGLIAGTALLSGTFSDGDDAEAIVVEDEDAASPAQ